MENSKVYAKSEHNDFNTSSQHNFNKGNRLERYASIDLIRGIALFLNVFVHLFTDVFDINTIKDNLFGLPLSLIVLFVAIGYFGSYGSFFILISGTGNMISMYKGFERGKSVKSVIKKQILSGIILIIFSFLVEGFFQFYGYLGTIFAWNGHPHDPTRIIWHAYVMTPVLCLAVGMVLTGIIQFFLSLNGGYKKYTRNIVVYIILSIIILILSQPIWDLCKALGPPGFPNATYGSEYPGDYKVFMPPPNANLMQLIGHFFLTLGGGSNHPIFPYAIHTFAGNIIGILLIKATNEENPDPHMPKKGMIFGIFVFLLGIILIPILGVDFDSILPVSAIGDITLIHDGRDGFWIPWWTFLLSGQIILAFFIIRLIEYRGIGKPVSDKTRFIRRFGVPAFSVYSWHRFWAIPVVLLTSYLAGQPSWVSGSITGTSLDWGWTIITIIGVWGICGLILILWEKIGFIGGIEWMMAEVGAIFGLRKSKGTSKEKPKWYEYGLIDMDRLFYNPSWINIIEPDEKYHANKSDSKLAYKLSILGLFTGVCAYISLPIALSSKKSEGNNDYNKKALIISIIGIITSIIVTIILSLLTLDMIGLSF